MPQLPTRKGLLVIDFQNDFLCENGVLPVVDHDALVIRTLDFVKAFRKYGQVIWVCTEFDKFRSASNEQIWATDEAPKPSALQSRARRKIASEPDPEVDVDAEPEAFLSQPGPKILQSGTPGAAFPTVVKDALDPRDITFIKSHYSAFTSGQLLQTLRVRFMTDLYLCGSLTNIGVYATAMDAAKYGNSITLVEDCCGFRSDLRHSNAVRSLVDVTGCEVQDSEAVLENLNPTRPAASAPSTLSPPLVPKRVVGSTKGPTLPPTDVSISKALEEQLAKLTLSSQAVSSSPNPSSRQRQSDPDCESSSDSLEVDPDAQPPHSTETGDAFNGEPSGEAAISRKNTSAAYQESSVASEKRTVEEPTILKAAVGDEPPVSYAGLEPESKPDMTTKTAGEQVAMGRTVDAEDSSSQATEPLCEGDTTVIYNVLPEPLAEGIFEKVRDEVRWQRMSHQGGEVPRLVAVQGEVSEDGSMPVYRHPSDESPPLLAFSPIVLQIKAEVEKQLGHPLNHALIQFYRDGSDYISEHSDKTLDIVKGSYIANVSLGAERTMVFRTKRRERDPSTTEPSPNSEESSQRRVSRAKLPHNSLCRMGLVTNMRWLHAIRQDKRADRDKTAPERAFSGGRISLTFRQIGTFLDRDNTVIWGQGATGKTREEAHPVINGQSPEAVGMLRAFGTENHSTEFDWDKYYGKGFDVLHMSNSPRLCVSSDSVVNMRIALMLAEYAITYARGSMSPSFNWKDGIPEANDMPAVPDTLPIRFIDSDAAKSTVQGELAIMLYLDSVYGPGKGRTADRPKHDTARVLTRFQQGLALLDKWRRLKRDNEGQRDLKPLKRELAAWDRYAAEADFIAGLTVSLADFSVWPVLHAIVEESGTEVLTATSKLAKYYNTFKDRESTAKVLDSSQTDSVDAV
ncbi:DNA oxidative demethylase ALKBH2-like protein 2 [Colletotrichum chlorophyti]|uniref:DNA oxidative demethylase ALKBH2-like protein 2 n=1 Tax=Colletotrichum chlorophyti TaxID=708187 RepID=A0A1Q8RPQ5_9PEZI|nr:DNA oxidative demethylase ALKBH2-like protein 2 [Colletotrichum chlorophyti]